jgi:hypothetical protein
MYEKFEDNKGEIRRRKEDRQYSGQKITKG